MSTRCQVQVVDQDGRKLTLYHHCDGYPSNMLKLFAKAWEKCRGSYASARAGHIACYLCSVDPDGFEPEDSHDLHGDIRYYYRIRPVEGRGPGSQPAKTWLVQTFRACPDSTEEDPGRLVSTNPVEIAFRDRKLIEKASYCD